MTSKTGSLRSYEVEIQRLDYVQKVALHVGTVRGARGRRKIYGEAFMRDPWNPWVHLKVQHAKDEDDLCDRFIAMIVHRGYVPLRARKDNDGVWGDCEALDLEKFDLTHHIIFGGGLEMFNK